MAGASGVTLRLATKEDGATLVRLVNAMAEYDNMPALDLPTQQRLLRDAFDKKRFTVVLAEWEGRAVGFATFYEGYSTFEARPTLFVDDLYIQSDFRGRHVGHELFRYCLREAQARDCGRMEWLVLDANITAFGFYDRLQTKKLDGWTHFRLTRNDIDKMA